MTSGAVRVGPVDARSRDAEANSGNRGAILDVLLKACSAYVVERTICRRR